MRILVAYGSKYGGTAGLAEMVANSLRRRDVDVEVRRASAVDSLDAFDAVIVGGALYANRWHKDARQCVARNRRWLARVPVYFFSSGPLDDSAATGEIPPVRQVAKLMDRVGGRGHVTFGGRLEPEAKGFITSKVAERASGDFRDAEHVDRWVDSIVATLRSETPAPQ